MRENKKLEFKEKITSTFLKTVSAYANYGEGIIKFGIKDDGSVIGMEDPIDACLRIENAINDAIKPTPQFELSIEDSTNVVSLMVKKGSFPPYYYKGKAYKRSDSASVAVDQIELSRLILQGQNRSFDSLPAQKQDLTFTTLNKLAKKQMGLKALSQDNLITLGLYNRQIGYTVAGELFADNNSFRGIDVVRFGENINIIRERAIYEHESILKEYDHALEFFYRYYSFEEIEGVYRKRKFLIPEEAFREAVANALVHRTWDVNAQIRISMFDDRIEISSPGGLSGQITKEDYLNGNISILRNPNVGNVFFRLNLIEQLGTGIQRIKAAYDKSATEPQFKLLDNVIIVTLPLSKVKRKELSGDDKLIFELIEAGANTTQKISEQSGIGKTKILKIIRRLMDNLYVRKAGKGRSTKYVAIDYVN